MARVVHQACLRRMAAIHHMMARAVQYIKLGYEERLLFSRCQGLYIRLVYPEWQQCTA
jgi:hypothetical protein